MARQLTDHEWSRNDTYTRTKAVKGKNSKNLSRQEI